MKKIIQLMQNRIKRREFFNRIAAWGLSMGVVKSIWGSLSASPPVRVGASSAPAAVDSERRIVEGTGGELLVEQLAAMGVKYIFNCESSGTNPIWESLVDRSDIQVIAGVHEGAVVAMAYGYALATVSEVPFTLCDSAGFFNKMTPIHSAFVSRTPLICGTERQDMVLQGGLENFEDFDEFLEPAAPFTKWRYSIDSAERIPELMRRAYRFAANPPGGPVALGLPKDVLAQAGVRAEISKEKINTTPAIAPSPAAVEKAARLLLEAESPLLFVGAEVTKYNAQSAVIRLAELLGIPVCFQRYTTIYSDFPSKHPLFLGQLNDFMRYPEKVDLFLAIGVRMPFERFGRVERGTPTIHITTDSAIMGREHPIEVEMIADAKQAAEALIEAIEGMATKERLSKISSPRFAATKSFTKQMQVSRDMAAKFVWNDSPLAWERIITELDQVLEEDAIIIQEMEIHDLANWMDCAPDKKQIIGLSESLGTLGVGGGLGVKLAKPDREVVVLTGDGGFLFGQGEMLWSLVRYQVPMIVIVFNNRSYDRPRTRKLMNGPRQLELGREMTSYLGNPNVDFVKIAEAFSVKGEQISAPNEVGPALKRAKNATRDGEAYLIEALVGRRGLLAESTWYPEISVAGMRKRKV
jgi:thiamine pyrophosphate-dependent acetolactate synthase large subunit-like protein